MEKKIKRSLAASLLTSINTTLYRAKSPEDFQERVRDILRAEGIEEARACNGEAHSNPHIDNCSVCLRGPGWGVVGPVVKVS